MSPGGLGSGLAGQQYDESGYLVFRLMHMTTFCLFSSFAHRLDQSLAVGSLVHKAVGSGVASASGGTSCSAIEARRELDCQSNPHCL